MNRLYLMVAASVLLATGAANAALVSNGNGLFYDKDRNITWYDAPHKAMKWSAALTWAADLTVQGASDWRLPTAGPEAFSTTSELGHLYFTELGNTRSNGGVLKTGGITTLQPWLSYWSGTAGQTGYAYFISTSGQSGYGGNQYPLYTGFNSCYVLAVHAGNVGAPAVPEPGTILAALAILCPAGMMFRRCKTA